MSPLSALGHLDIDHLVDLLLIEVQVDIFHVEGDAEDGKVLTLDIGCPDSLPDMMTVIFSVKV